MSKSHVTLCICDERQHALGCESISISILVLDKQQPFTTKNTLGSSYSIYPSFLTSKIYTWIICLSVCILKEHPLKRHKIWNRITEEGFKLMPFKRIFFESGHYGKSTALRSTYNCCVIICHQPSSSKQTKQSTKTAFMESLNSCIEAMSSFFFQAHIPSCQWCQQTAGGRLT